MTKLVEHRWIGGKEKEKKEKGIRKRRGKKQKEQRRKGGNKERHIHTTDHHDGMGGARMAKSQFAAISAHDCTLYGQAPGQ
eukprot:1152346-Pelagomonas_calceolata.AAC.6